MKIRINNDTFAFDNKENTIDAIFELIERTLKENDLQLSHLVIDENVVNEEFYQYFVDNIDKIEDVIVVIKSVEILVSEILISAYQYFDNSLTILPMLSEQFYQSPKQDSWKCLANLFEGIQWIIETLNRIDAFKNLENIILDYKIWNEYVQIIIFLTEQMKELENALVNQDSILIGDLLQFEILPIFEKSKEKLRFLIPSGGCYYAS